MFTSARLKLTAWYLLIIMFVSISFSLVINSVLRGEVERFAAGQELRLERRYLDDNLPPPASPFIDPDVINQTENRVSLMLVVVNGAIFLIAGTLGFFLAGRTLEPIQLMLDEQNQFISDASHELRTPITALKSSLEVFLRDKKPSLPDAKLLVGDSLAEVNKLQSLSDSLLQLAQYQKPHQVTRFESVKLTDLINDSIRQVYPLAKNKKITINTSLTDVTLEADKFSLSDLIVILLDNAIKYSPDGSQIEVKSGRTDGSVFFSVTDQGIGIDAKDIPHIFDRFYRSDTARSKSRAGGYGLGLSIAKKIVDLHHGTISVQSIIRKGTKFTVKLPVKHSASFQL